MYPMIFIKFEKVKGETELDRELWLLAPAIRGLETVSNTETRIWVEGLPEPFEVRGASGDILAGIEKQLERMNRMSMLSTVGR